MVVIVGVTPKHFRRKDYQLSHSHKKKYNDVIKQNSLLLYTVVTQEDLK